MIFTDRDYQEIEAAARDIFKGVLRNYDLYGFNKQSRQMLLERAGIRFGIIKAIFDSYLDDYNTNHDFKELISDCLTFNEEREIFIDELYAVIRTILQHLIEEEI